MVAAEVMPRPKGKTPPRVSLSARVSPDVLMELDAIAQEMGKERGIPVSTSQVIELGLKRFIEQYRKAKK